MTFSELAKERFSCRKFSSKTVEQDKIDIILNAALAAPTAVNKQPQRILVINDSEKLEKLKECTKYTFDAPLCFIVCCDSSKAYTRGYDGKNSAEIDASIVTTHMMLQAQDIGLGTTWVMAFNPTKVRECFSIADNLDIIALLPTGYPAENVTVSPLHEKSIDITEMASYNEF